MSDKILIEKIRMFRALLFNPPVPAIFKGQVNAKIAEYNVVEIIDEILIRLSK